MIFVDTISFKQCILDYKKEAYNSRDANPVGRMGDRKPHVTKHIPLNETLNSILLFVLCASCIMA